jgi:predicted RNA binding protein YcfA (HicA-like mRNA interferase family)
LSPKLPAVTGREVARVAEKLGFRLRHQVGSHPVYSRQDDGARVTIPMHAGKTIKPGTLRSIITDLRTSPEEFRGLL